MIGLREPFSVWVVSDHGKYFVFKGHLQNQNTTSAAWSFSFFLVTQSNYNLPLALPTLYITYVRYVAMHIRV